MDADSREDQEGLSWIESHRRRFGQDFVEELLDSFIADLRARIADARQIDPADRALKVRAHLHSVRGGAQHIAHAEIASACQDGLEAASAGDGARAFKALCALEDMFTAWRASLQPDTRTHPPHAQGE